MFPIPKKMIILDLNRGALHVTQLLLSLMKIPICISSVTLLLYINIRVYGNLILIELLLQL